MDLIKKLRYIFNKQQKLKFIFLFIIMFIGALFELVGVSLILPFVQIVMEPNIIEQNKIMKTIYEYFNIHSTNHFLLIIAISLIVVYIIKNLYLLCMYYAQYTFTFNNQMRMSTKLMDCYLKKPYTFHLQKNTAEIVRSVTVDVSQLFTLVLNCLLLLSELLVSLMLGIFLLAMDIFITTFVIGFLTISMFLFFFIFRKKLKIYGLNNQKYNGQMIKWINQSLGGIKEIKIMHREQFFVNSFSYNGNEYAKNRKKFEFINQIPKLMLETICIVGMLILVAIMLFIGKDMSNLIPKLAVFAMAAFRLLPSINRINNYINIILFHKPSIDLIYKDLKETNNLVNNKTKDAKVNEIKTDFDLNKTIEISHISFKYPQANKYVFKNISFEIPIGKSTAFIGPSGAGKTTMADIILGLLKLEDGEILVNGINVYDNLRKWSEKIGYIPQTIYLSDDTIRNNIAFGIEENKIDDKAIWKALEQAQLKEFIQNQKDKLNTLIGERGVRLSGGQRQRIGIARALYSNPEILVLDEATSSLDTETEQAVMEAIDSLHGKKTLIIIAHRLTTIENCDLIYEIKDNTVKIQKNKLGG